MAAAVMAAAVTEAAAPEAGFAAAQAIDGLVCEDCGASKRGR
jgi:hypothetical protein